jgi:hypothetical protein
MQKTIFRIEDLSAVFLPENEVSNVAPALLLQLSDKNKTIKIKTERTFMKVQSWN